MTSQTPQSRHTKLQLPLSDDETRKRRRNTSGSPSDDPTLYSTPPEYIGGGLPSAFSSDGSIIRSQAPHLTALNRSNNKHAYISSALGHASLQSSAANEVEAKGGANFDPLLDPQTSYNSYKTFPQQEGYGQEGLNSTLAVRNASAAQFYNINELSPRSTTTLARPNTSQGVGADSSVTFPHSFTFGDSVSAPVGSEHLGFYPNGGALPFDQPQLSLPSMPFGMTPQEINSSPPLFSNVCYAGFRQIELRY